MNVYVRELLLVPWIGSMPTVVIIRTLTSRQQGKGVCLLLFRFASCNPPHASLQNGLGSGVQTIFQVAITCTRYLVPIWP